FYPGVTVTGVGSVYVPEELGEAYLKAIAHSLLRQGFRRQIYLSAHGASDQFVAAMVRQFFEEIKDTILYMHVPMSTRGGRGAGATAQTPNPSNFRAIGYGAYQVVGRLGELPLNLDVPKATDAPLPKAPDSLRTALGPLAGGVSAVGSYDPDAEHNGGR